MRTWPLLLLPGIVSAFVNVPLSRFSRETMRMVVQDDLAFDAKLGQLEVEKAGVSAPLGFFDPLNFYGGKSTRQKKKLREAELKHGRVAMLAVLGILVQENFHPLLGGGDIGIAVDHYYQIEEIVPDFWVSVLFVLSLFEAKGIAKGWDPIDETLSNPKIAGLRDDFVAGDLDFDPLGLCPDDAEGFINMRTKELNNGRMAMIAAFGIIGQELATRVPINQALFGGSS